ncbi:MAG: precorrin-6y C5,15-methyltransferase (decarboxylating) subunit CbiE [Spirochaetaceae bacterium]|jgi:precorrin-6Y C5,15-methyltransferase (decarboxylating)|nr:precorrin-6y C5,15-methyltransferase (decarboxylating) subunit CbiE [Spirochaetaceae bacterium]
MPRKLIYIIGAGPGSWNLLTREALDALLHSERVLGAKRLLDSLKTLIQDKKTDALVNDKSIVEKIQLSDEKVYAVLVSGDSGFFSLSRQLLPPLRAEALKNNWELQTLCGVSSVAYFAARLGVPYDDAAIKSFHGRLDSKSTTLDKERLLNLLTGVTARNRKCFFLTDNIVSPALICRALSERGFGELRISIGERLSYTDEKISSGKISGIARAGFAVPNIVYIENDKSVKNIFINPRDSDFIRGSVPMTKENVRAISLSKLNLKPDAVCWDIGAGTGAVSCSMSLAAPYGRVYAVEKNLEALSLMRQNKEKTGCYNMEIVEGEAPAVLSALPPPDAVFIGGSSGTLSPVLHEILKKNPGARIVINAVTLETLSMAQSIIAENHFPDVEIAQISVSEFTKTGSYTLARAQNPVFVISFGGGA